MLDSVEREAAAATGGSAAWCRVWARDGLASRGDAERARTLVYNIVLDVISASRRFDLRFFHFFFVIFCVLACLVALGGTRVGDTRTHTRACSRECGVCLGQNLQSSALSPAVAPAAEVVLPGIPFACTPGHVRLYGICRC